MNVTTNAKVTFATFKVAKGSN